MDELKLMAACDELSSLLYDIKELERDEQIMIVQSVVKTLNEAIEEVI